MVDIVLALVIGFILLIGHGIFTGLALVATWYFGHVAEQKLLKEAQGIHKEVTDQIKKMNKDQNDYDKIDDFLESQKKMMQGFMSEIGRRQAIEIGAVLDEKMKQIPTAVGAAKQASTADRFLGVIEQVAAAALQGAGE